MLSNHLYASIQCLVGNPYSHIFTQGFGNFTGLSPSPLPPHAITTSTL
jgi:hypothetical protein